MRLAIFTLAVFILLCAASAGQQTKKKDEKPPDTGTAKEVTKVGGKTLDKWIEEISAKDPSKRAMAMRTVLAFGPEKAQQAVPAILKELGKHRPLTAPTGMSVRLDGAMALGTILSSAKEPDPKDIAEAVRILKTFCHDEQVLVKARAVQALAALARLGPNIEIHKALNDVVAIAQNPDTWEARQAGLQCLVILTVQDKDPPPESVRVSFYKGLKDNSMLVRITAAQSLAQYTQFKVGTPGYITLVYNLENATKDVEPAVQIWSNLALVTIKMDPKKPAVGPQHLTAIAKMLEHPDAKVLEHADSSIRVLAAQSLGQIGPLAQPVSGKVIAALSDPDRNVVAACIVALARMKALNAVPALERLSEDPKMDAELQQAARNAIEIIKYGKNTTPATK
jgi:HEAT repeat protein